jgi:hypothetical protein
VNNTAYIAGYLAKSAEDTEEGESATIAMPSAAVTTHTTHQDPYGSPGDPSINEIPGPKSGDAPKSPKALTTGKNTVNKLWSNQ